MDADNSTSTEGGTTQENSPQVTDDDTEPNDRPLTEAEQQVADYLLRAFAAIGNACERAIVLLTLVLTVSGLTVSQAAAHIILTASLTSLMVMWGVAVVLAVVLVVRYLRRRLRR
jgi:hypothetical protein